MAPKRSHDDSTEYKQNKKSKANEKESKHTKSGAGGIGTTTSTVEKKPIVKKKRSKDANETKMAATAKAASNLINHSTVRKHKQSKTNEKKSKHTKSGADGIGTSTSTIEKQTSVKKHSSEDADKTKTATPEAEPNRYGNGGSIDRNECRCKSCENWNGCPASKSWTKKGFL